MTRSTIKAKDIMVPADVPSNKHDTYVDNYRTVTKDTGRFFIFACDQKIEHLNNDFYGTNIHADANRPSHIFTIGQQGEIGALATHPGLIARYAAQYKHINYIAKLNGKTPLITAKQADPISRQLWFVEDVVQLASQSGLPIRGVGYTMYLGSEFESIMLEQAAQIIYKAHQAGLLAMLWIYPRGKAIKNDTDGMLLSGACGIATSLGADIVKIKPPADDTTQNSDLWLHVATQAAGNTNVICAGGHILNVETLLQKLYEQMHEGMTAGCAMGRNIFQRSEREAVRLTKAIAALVYENASVDHALKLYRNKHT